MQMFWVFKLRFVVDIFGLFWLGNFLGYSLKNLAIFFSNRLVTLNAEKKGFIVSAQGLNLLELFAVIYLNTGAIPVKIVRIYANVTVNYAEKSFILSAHEGL